MFIFQPSSKIPISPFFFHFKKAKLVWPAAIPYFLSNPSLEEGPTFTASLACGWNRLVAKMGSCGLPNRLRRPNQYFLFICFHLKKKICLCLIYSCWGKGFTAKTVQVVLGGHLTNCWGVGGIYMGLESSPTPKTTWEGTRGMEFSTAIH